MRRWCAEGRARCPGLVTLAPPDWRLTREQLAAAFSPKTKAIMLNQTPSTGRAGVFGGELDLVAEFVEGRRFRGPSFDEVYEHLVFSRTVAHPADHPAGHARAVPEDALGRKTFSLTGWKARYMSWPPELIQPVAKVHQFLVFTTPPNLQAGRRLRARQRECVLHRPCRPTCRPNAIGSPRGRAAWPCPVLDAQGT